MVAALALGVPVGFAGMPVLSQGASLAVGAFATALLRVRADWPLEATLPVAFVVGGLSGALVGAAAARLRSAYVAATTWLFAWLVALGLAAFPGWSGGDAGLVLPDPALGVTAHYELGLGLAVLAGLGVRALGHSPFALRLRAHDDRPAAAAALRVPALRLRLGAVVVSAAVAGLVGGLAVDLATVADPASYGPLLSFQLLAAVLLGGATSALGPADRGRPACAAVARCGLAGARRGRTGGARAQRGRRRRRALRSGAGRPWPRAAARAAAPATSRPPCIRSSRESRAGRAASPRLGARGDLSRQARTGLVALERFSLELEPGRRRADRAERLRQDDGAPAGGRRGATSSPTTAAAERPGGSASPARSRRRRLHGADGASRTSSSARAARCATAALVADRARHAESPRRGRGDAAAAAHDASRCRARAAADAGSPSSRGPEQRLLASPPRSRRSRGAAARRDVGRRGGRGGATGWPRSSGGSAARASPSCSSSTTCVSSGASPRPSSCSPRAAIAAGTPRGRGERPSVPAAYLGTHAL